MCQSQVGHSSILLACAFCAAVAGAQPTNQPRAGRFETAELGANAYLSPAGLFGLIGGSLMLAPLPFLVLEVGVAQRLEERPRGVALMRVRVWRAGPFAASVGAGLDRQRQYEEINLGCAFDEYECGRKGRNVWAMPIQVSLEVRFPENITIQPHVGLKVPVHWDSCREYSGGEDIGRCIPLLRPYVGVAVGWTMRLGRKQTEHANGMAQ